MGLRFRGLRLSFCWEVVLGLEYGLRMSGPYIPTLHLMQTYEGLNVHQNASGTIKDPYFHPLVPPHAPHTSLNLKRLSSGKPEKSQDRSKRPAPAPRATESTLSASSQYPPAPLRSGHLRPADRQEPAPWLSWLQGLRVQLLIWGKCNMKPDGPLHIVHGDDYHDPNMGLDLAQKTLRSS